MKRSLLLPVLLALLPAAADAAVSITIEEVGGNVVFTVTGDIGIPPISSGNQRGGFDVPPVSFFPQSGFIAADTPAAVSLYQVWSISNGPASWGAGPGTQTGSWTGDYFFLYPGEIGLPLGRNTVDTAITIPGDFQSLGLNPNLTATYTIGGAGGTTDTLSVQAVPEPSAAVLGFVALAGCAFHRRRR